MTTLSCPRQQQQAPYAVSRQTGLARPDSGSGGYSSLAPLLLYSGHRPVYSHTLRLLCVLTVLLSPPLLPVVLASSSRESLLWCDQEHPGSGQCQCPRHRCGDWRPSARCLTKERIAAASTKIIDPNSVPFLPQLYFLPSLLVSTFSINKKKLRNRIFPLFSQI